MCNQPYTHLPRQDSECVDITGRRGSCVGQAEALVVNQFRSSAAEKPIGVHPGHAGWKKGHPKTSKVSMATSINENV